MRIIFFITACLLLNACTSAKHVSGGFVGEIVTQEGDYIELIRHFYVDPFDTSDYADGCLNNKVAPVAANYCSNRGKYTYYDDKNTDGICSFRCATEDELPYKTSNITTDFYSRVWTNYDPVAFIKAPPPDINWAGVAAGMSVLNDSLYGSSGTGYSTMGTSSGSYSSGMTKVCNYSCAGSAYSITVGAAELCPLNPPCKSPAKKSDNNISSGSTTCFSKGEYTSGMNKVCNYDCVGSAHSITIGAAELCPVSVQR